MSISIYIYIYIYNRISEITKTNNYIIFFRAYKTSLSLEKAIYMWDLINTKVHKEECNINIV